MIVYSRLNEEYGIVVAKCVLEYHKELESPISQAGFQKNKPHPWEMSIQTCKMWCGSR